jgi:hypothetical protein
MPPVDTETNKRHEACRYRHAICRFSGHQQTFSLQIQILTTDTQPADAEKKGGNAAGRYIDKETNNRHAACGYS